MGTWSGCWAHVAHAMGPLKAPKLLLCHLKNFKFGLFFRNLSVLSTMGWGDHLVTIRVPEHLWTLIVAAAPI